VSGAQPQDVFTELLRRAVADADTEGADSGAAPGGDAEGCADDSCAV